KNRVAPNALEHLDARCDLYAMRVSPTGAILDPQGFALSTSPIGETDPTVAAHNGVSLFAWAQMFNDTNFANYRIVTRRLDASANQWPVAVATASTNAGIVPLTVQFSAAGSTDPDGAVIGYFWEFSDGTSSTLPNPVRTFSAPGNYLVKLTVTDNLGATATQALMIQAAAPNQNPVAIARAVPQSGPPPLNVTLYADSSYDPDGVIGNIEWLFSDDGSTYWGATAYHTFQTAGQHIVTLRVHDGRGGVGTTNILINVGGPNLRPVAVVSATPTNGPAPLWVEFRGSDSYDRDGNIVSYAWTFGDGGTANYANPVYAYLTPGQYTARLVVTDNAGGKGTNSVVITVGASNRPPVAVVSANPTRGAAPLTVNFSSAGSSDPDGSIVAYAWSFGDGGTSTAPNPVYTYANRGTFTARLTVTDNRGATASNAVTINVRQPPRLTNARVNLPGTFAFNLEGETNVTYVLQASPDGVHWTNVMVLPSPDMPAPLALPTGSNSMLLWRAVMQ
ncbi:MAG: PKD domain-containing protein, partial [Verrucomicrobiales bacterium]|nr:PKD domain-containing protein [Verrucomicrobiales bacterium]